jgi:hypothetical protein
VIEIIEKTILETIPDYLDEQSLLYPHEINTGNCKDFAQVIINKLGGETKHLYGIWLSTHFDIDCCHYVIVYRRDDGTKRFFDSEIPSGTTCPFQIPFVKRKMEV